MPAAVAAAATALMLARAIKAVRSECSAVNRISLPTADDALDWKMKPFTSVESPAALDSKSAARDGTQFESSPSIIFAEAET